MKRNFFLSILVFIMIAGCMHTVYVPLLPDFDANIYGLNKLANVQPAVKFSQGDFADKSSDIGLLATFKQGIHTYNLYEERPIDEALFEGLNVLLTSSGHEWVGTGEGEIKVDLQLLSVQASRYAGLINVGANSSIQIKLDFIDPSTNDVIYTQIYNGTDERAQALVGLMDLVKKSIDASIINCINSVGDDDNLAQKLSQFRL
ncbi:MAG: hypothetical protein ACETWG_11545 [Candidatus Neomarinimicrobiota bacterium]